ncbi:MAG: response regulator receiver protein [Myxococcales bacterium]|nr:response regulator receiver protein [Myxococcales bacterium]
MKRILICDDSPIILAAVRGALADAGYDVTTRSGIDDLAANPVDGFDLILMDVEMPELFGDDVASILRLERGVKTPIYLFSSLDDAQLAELAKTAKVDGFISKQAGIPNLVERVRAILS